MVSVIIPTYNRACFVREAVISVLNQTFRDFEVLVYDDGSTDSTADLMNNLCRIYADAGLRYIRSAVNRGVSHARNRAVAAAQGRYIAFLDSDDLWLKNKLMLQTRFMEDTGALICQTGEVWIRNGRRVNPRKIHEKPAGHIFERCLELCLVSPSAVMMRRELFDDTGGFDEGMPACEDYDLWLRISRTHPVHLIRKNLVIKRGGHEDQLSRTVPFLDRYRIYSMEKLLKSGELAPAMRAAVIVELKKKCAIYAKGSKKYGRTDEARRYERIAEEHNH